MNHRLEILALCALLIGLIGLPAGVLAYRSARTNTLQDGVSVVNLVARSPERGGWAPDLITVNVGETVRFRITSEDVAHGFAIGHTGVAAGTIYPGEFVTVEFPATEPGRFTFYCNVWCSPFHNRMRGTLIVLDPDHPDDLPTSRGGQAAMPVAGEVDVDSPHEAEYYAKDRPSVARGVELYAELYGSAPLDDAQRQSLRSESPSRVFQMLRRASRPFALPPARTLTEEETWDVVAYLWWQMTTPQGLAQGRGLYDKNCAACHGLDGAGGRPGERIPDESPGDLSDAEIMAGGTSQLFVAKTRRGGMGTGMPSWGAIFTEEELVNIVDYIWSFAFSYDHR